MGSALQDRKTPEGDENNRKNRLETYSTIFLDSTGKEYARIEWVPPLKGAQPRISGFCFFAMIDWIPSEGRNPFRMGSAPQRDTTQRWPLKRQESGCEILREKKNFKHERSLLGHGLGYINNMGPCRVLQWHWTVCAHGRRLPRSCCGDSGPGGGGRRLFLGCQRKIWQHLCVFFWQNVAIYALFRKISPFMQFFGKMSRFTHFFLGSAQTVKITLSSAFKFLSALPPPPSKGGARKSPVPRRSVKEGKGGKMLKKVSDHKKGRMGEHQSKQALSSVWPHNRSL